ncbi:DUF3658 domain-containing protein [Hyphococcus flavus]|uniref:DUF3658 domain-containing protein n=1 Tax=Hyphococcus flavus TaxID=1866326 RepID=A0AAE9ZGQ0_9PROT|nr:DUF3658 domain-containing protein [Hyphococcus flavus]WDI30531.1 DUF3658 domain-containing protein [Hyphococcus flavus]
MESVHIVFSHSAAAGLREALTSAGTEEKIINCWGDYHAGPLAVSLDERLNWLCANYYDVGDGDSELRDEYKKRHSWMSEIASNSMARKIIWYSKVCARDYCGYLNFVTLAQEGFDLLQSVDLATALPKENARKALSVGWALPRYLLQASSFRCSISEDELRNASAVWGKMKKENKALRVFTNDGLISAEVDFFDEAILDFVTNQYQRAPYVIGNVLGYVDAQTAFTQSNSDFFYFRRLKELHKQGRVIWRGGFENMRDAAVRLAS